MLTLKAEWSYFGPKHLEQTTLSYIHFIENAQPNPSQHYLGLGQYHQYWKASSPSGTLGVYHFVNRLDLYRAWIGQQDWCCSLHIQSIALTSWSSKGKHNNTNIVAWDTKVTSWKAINKQISGAQPILYLFAPSPPPSLFYIMLIFHIILLWHQSHADHWNQLGYPQRQNAKNRGQRQWLRLS